MEITTTKINNFNLLINKFYYLLIKLSKFYTQFKVIFIYRGVTRQGRKRGDFNGHLKALGKVKTMTLAK